MCHSPYQLETTLPSPLPLVPTPKHRAAALVLSAAGSGRHCLSPHARSASSRRSAQSPLRARQAQVIPNLLTPASRASSIVSCAAMMSGRSRYARSLASLPSSRSSSTLARSLALGHRAHVCFIAAPQPPPDGATKARSQMARDDSSWSCSRGHRHDGCRTPQVEPEPPRRAGDPYHGLVA